MRVSGATRKGENRMRPRRRSVWRSVTAG